MGIKLFSDTSLPEYLSLPDKIRQKLIKYFNSWPNKKNCYVLLAQEVGDLIVVKMNYPDCNNYNGNKVLVYERFVFNNLTKKNEFDPHFIQNQESPIARFEPTEFGWKCALGFAEMLRKAREKFNER